MTVRAQPARVAALFSAASLFLWMFFAAAPIETLADRGGLAGGNRADNAVAAYRFAADWRHGMAGNSPLYMPGFFALAVAAWVWSACHGRPRSVTLLVFQGATVLLTALPFALFAAHLTQPVIVSTFERAAGLQVVERWPTVPARAIGQGVYTAAAWLTFVVACRRALAARVWRPLFITMPLTIVLAMVRPWTVDDFVALWMTRAVSGDWAALGSALAIPAVVWILVLTESAPASAEK